MPTVQKEEQGAPSQLSQQCERPCECTLTSDPTKKTVSYKAGYRLKIYRSFKSIFHVGENVIKKQDWRKCADRNGKGEDFVHFLTLTSLFSGTCTWISSLATVDLSMSRSFRVHNIMFLWLPILQQILPN